MCLARRHFLPAALVVLITATASAKAAVRTCGDLITTTGTGKDELEAKKAALDLWKAQAESLGTGFGAWRLAIDKVLTCKPEAEGKLICVANARPCTIEQAPNTRELRSKRLDL